MLDCPLLLLTWKVARRGRRHLEETAGLNLEPPRPAGGALDMSGEPLHLFLGHVLAGTSTKNTVPPIKVI